MNLLHLSLLGAVCAAACLSWVLLWPLVSVTTGEAKPRGLFIAERALAGPGNARARYSAAHARHAIEEAVSALDYVNSDAAASFEDAAARLARACARANMSAEILQPLRQAVVCSAPAAGNGRAFEYMLLSGEGEAAIAMLLSVSALVARAPWLAKDLVLLLPVAGIPAADALAAFLRAHDYDGHAEARRRALQTAWAGSSPLSYLAAWSRGDAAPAAGGSRVQPLVSTHGVLRAALHLRITPSAALTLGLAATGGGSRIQPPAVGVALAAPGSRLPELDLPSLLFAALEYHGLRGVVADSSNAGAGGGDGGKGGVTGAADCRLAAAAETAARWAVSADGEAVLQPWLRLVVAPVATLVRGSNDGGRGGPFATGADTAVYLRRLVTAVRMLLRLLLGPYEPHAAVTLRGVPAATLIVAQPAEWECGGATPAGIATPLRFSACHVLAPCHEAPPTLSALPGAAPAVALGAALEMSLRSLSGIEERLHASPPHFLLLSPRLFVGLLEYALPLALLHVPLLAMLLLVGWRAERRAAEEEAAVATLFAAAAAAKLAVCLLAGSPGAPSEATLPILLATLDAVIAGAAAPALRRWLVARDATCCPPYVSPAEDAGIGPLPPPPPPPRGSQRARTLPPPLFVAWLCLAAQQLPLFYLDFPLFASAAVLLVPTLLVLSAAACASALVPPASLVPPPSPPPAARAAATAAVTTVLAVAYAVVAPACWPLSVGQPAAARLLAHLLHLLRAHGALHLPVLLHAQALLGLVASAAIAHAW